MKGMHVGIILDGNRRFAKRLMKEPWKGHEYGAKKLEDFLDWSREFGIKQITFYGLSLENLRKRSKKELAFLIKIFKDEFTKLKSDKRIDDNKIRINFIGKREFFDKEMQEMMEFLEKKTKKYNNYIINFALAYGGRQEIIEAVKKLVKSKKEINEESFTKELLIQDEPDLIIRTGGEKRTSNFLVWQSAYSEWFFLDKMWPEFTKSDLKKVLKEFSERERRFGK
jgi:tritrans,polycis-undecaprenyl-diphosphate synthase [geranylgeranyl-diphosphate specific]